MNFDYDYYHRVTRIYPPAGASYGYEKRFYYDSYAADPGSYTYGRLAAIEWAPPPVFFPTSTQSNSYKHVFGYTNYGAVTRSKLVADSSYTPSGGEPNSWQTVLEASFSWTMQGELASITYPSGRYLYYKFDSAGRLNGLHQNPGGVSPNNWTDLDLVTNTSFTAAGQLATMDFEPVSGRRETRSYNSLLQLTGLWVGNPSGSGKALDLSYSYAAGANNGRISAETNNLTGVRVDYTYDQLNRLSTAVTRTGATTNWGLQFGYDIYGNRTSQTVTAGSAPQSTFAFDNNNRMIGYSYDANGNQLSTPDGSGLEYDADNRMSKWSKPSTGATEQYQYHPAGWRVWKGASYSTAAFSLYGPGGQLLSEGTSTHYVYFGGRLLYTMSGSGYTAYFRDRLGSTRYTEGQETVTRTDPRTWNRYSYAGDDPINYVDSRGLRMCLEFCPNWGQGGGGVSWRFGFVYVPDPEGGFNTRIGWVPTLLPGYAPEGGGASPQSRAERFEEAVENARTRAAIIMSTKPDCAGLFDVNVARRDLEREREREAMSGEDLQAALERNRGFMSPQQAGISIMGSLVVKIGSISSLPVAAKAGTPLGGNTVTVSTFEVWNLIRNPEDLLRTLLHEGLHSLGISDVSGTKYESAADMNRDIDEHCLSKN